MTYFWRQMTEMKKKSTLDEYTKINQSDESAVSEPLIGYSPTMATRNFAPQTGGYTYADFQRITRKLPLTIKEWSQILHLSERTLQRYAQNNTDFDGIYSDRLLQINDLFELGINTFVSGEAFYDWLKKDKMILGYQLNFSALYSSQGIQLLVDEVGRIQMGVYI